jgi:hypothetical protein
MSDLSSNDILYTLEHTNAHDAIRVDSDPEDWESIIDFETKNNMDGSSMVESNENESSLYNRSKAEQDPMEKSDVSMHVEVEDDLKTRSTQAAPDEGNGTMELDDTSNKGFENEDKNFESKTTLSPNNEGSTNVDDIPPTTNPPVPITIQMFHRLLQKSVIANDQQLNRPRSMVESYKPLDGILKNFDETDKASIGIFNNLVYLPPYLVEKYLAPTATALQQINETALQQINELTSRSFSELGAMIIKPLFTQACLTGTGGPHEAVASNITEQPLAKTVSSTVIDLKDVMKSKDAALQKYVKQLRKAAELPDEQTILSMADEELTYRNQRLEQLFTNFEEQIKRDYLILQKIRSDNIMLANVNYSQLKRLHQLTNDYTQVQLEKAELLQKVDDLDITSKVTAIQDNLNELKATLNDKLTGLTQIVRPCTDQPLIETNAKLKEALREAIKTNGRIVKKYDELSLHYSFMPQQFRDMVTQMKDEKRSHISQSKA